MGVDCEMCVNAPEVNKGESQAAAICFGVNMVVVQEVMAMADCLNPLMKVGIDEGQSAVGGGDKS